MQPLPSVNQTYSMLDQEEFQCQISSPLLFTSEPTAFYSSTITNSSSKRRFIGAYDHCHVWGHKRENCYKLIGFPPDFKFTRKKSVATNVTSSIDSIEPYQQLLTILQKDLSISATAHVAGTPYSSTSSSWILNTRATNHMTFDFQCLNSSVALAPNSSCVQLPNGKSTFVTYVGHLILSPTYKLTNVLHIPDFNYNLLSVSQLTKDLNCFVSFYPSFCLLQDLCSGRMLGIGKEHADLYYFHPHQLSSSLVYPHKSANISLPLVTSFMALHNDPHVWHARLGHTSVSIMKKFCSIKICFT
ncbi:hypothetical protein V6Z11_A12G164100 [Gossypium hirsutum]